MKFHGGNFRRRHIMARGTSSSSSSTSSEEDDAESSTSEMLSESEPLEDDDEESGSDLDPRRVVVNRVAKLKDQWKQTLSAVDSVKEKIPSWTYLKLVDFIKDEWSNCR